MHISWIARALLMGVLALSSALFAESPWATATTDDDAAAAVSVSGGGGGNRGGGRGGGGGRNPAVLGNGVGGVGASSPLLYDDDSGSDNDGTDNDGGYYSNRGNEDLLEFAGRKALLDPNLQTGPHYWPALNDTARDACHFQSHMLYRNWRLHLGDNTTNTYWDEGDCSCGRTIRDSIQINFECWGLTRWRCTRHAPGAVRISFTSPILCHETDIEASLDSVGHRPVYCTLSKRWPEIGIGIVDPHSI